MAGRGSLSLARPSLRPAIATAGAWCNLEYGFSHDIHAQLDQNPARAGLQPSNINGLQGTSYFVVEYDVVSMSCELFLTINHINDLSIPL
jgi:hypothetical protein